LTDDAIDDRGQSIANGNSPGCLNLRKRPITCAITPMRRTRSRCCARAASGHAAAPGEQGDELSSHIKKTRSHETIAKCVGLGPEARPVIQKTALHSVDVAYGLGRNVKM